MSHAATTWAFQQNLPPTDKFILVTLADHANPEGNCFPSVRRLAQLTGFDESTVRRSIAKLVELGLVERATQWTVTGRQTSNCYDLRLDRSQGEGRTAPASPCGKVEGGGAHSATPEGRTAPASKNNRHRNQEYSSREIPRGDADGSAGKEDEALRSACLAAERGDLARAPDRVFVDYGTEAFNEWVRTYARLGLRGPTYSLRIVFDPKANASTRRNGAYFPSERPPGRDPPIECAA